MSESKEYPSDKWGRDFWPFFKNTDYGGMRCRPKFRPLEKAEDRPTILYNNCDIEMMALELCRLNVHVRRFHKVSEGFCKPEFEDMKECLSGEKRRKLDRRLLAASRKAGDPIPHMQGFPWSY